MISNILKKRINREKAKDHFVETIQQMGNRKWMEARDEIRKKIQSGKYSDEEVLKLSHDFDNLKKNPPKVDINV